MKPRRKPRHEPWEGFTFEVENWDFAYGLHVNRARGQVFELLGPVWETQQVELHGPLRSKSRRKVERVRLVIDAMGEPLAPPDPSPATGIRTARGIGYVNSLRHGVLTAYVHLPPHSFSSVFVAIVARMFKLATIDADFSGSGPALITDVMLPGHLPDEEAGREG